MIASRKNILIFSILPFTILFLIYELTFITSCCSSSFLMEYRLLRAVYSSVAGAVLAVTGCFLQSSFRNPLVDHHILGIGSGALFFTYTTVFFYGYNPFTVALAAAMGGLISLLLTVLIAEKISGSDVAYVLAGISVTTLFSGLSTFMLYYVQVKYPYASVLMAGSFILSRPQILPYLLVPVVFVSLGYPLLAKRLNVLLLGDENAQQLGVDPRLTRLASALIAGFSSSIIVCLFGLIGFIGLIAPHIARFLIKTSDNRLIMPLSASLGMILLYSADLFSRTVMAPIWGEIPAGSIVSLFGAPFFIILLITRFTGRKT
ncbi:MAG: iron ABC transporter permease [Desulfurococcaceae archaeon]